MPNPVNKAAKHAHEDDWFQKPINERIPWLWPGDPPPQEPGTTKAGKIRPMEGVNWERYSQIRGLLEQAQLPLNEEGVNALIQMMNQGNPNWYTANIPTDQPQQAAGIFNRAIDKNLMGDRFRQQFASEQPHIPPTYEELMQQQGMSAIQGAPQGNAYGPGPTPPPTDPNAASNFVLPPKDWRTADRR